MCPTGKLNVSNWKPADLSVWKTSLATVKLPESQSRAGERHKIGQRADRSRNGIYIMIKLNRGGRGNTELINSGVKEMKYQ